MSSTNKTPNYALPQFVPTDKPTWLGDVNAAMLAIDTAMADNHTIAEGANTTAAGAEAKVQAAVDTANEAKVDSAAALQTATSATGVAQNALTAATSATQTANAASTQAQQAAGTAAQASAVATNASNLANQTAANLTEFQHSFGRIFTSLDGYPGAMAINPGAYALFKEGETTVTESEILLWKFPVELYNTRGNPTWEFTIDGGLVIVFHAFANGAQEIGVKSNSQFTSKNTMIFTLTSDWAFYQKVVGAFPSAYALCDDSRSCAGLLISHSIS